MKARCIETHNSAVVDYGAVIGEGTKIWHFSHICEGAKIGKNVIIGQNCYIGPGAVVGDGCKIQNNVSVYDGVVLEDRVFVGPSVVFTNVKVPRAFMEQKDNFKETRVKEGATIGANATIVCGNLIGRYALVGAGAVVTKEVEDFAVVRGTPARRVGSISIEGIIKLR